jgi:protein-disulfide isomerase
MTQRLFAAVVLCGALSLSACAEAESGDSTADLSQSLLSQPSDDGRSTVVAADPALQDDGGSPVRVSEVGFNRGLEEAPVKVVEMSDYGCGYCRQFHEETFPSIREEFIETGMVEWKFVPYITGMFDNSLAATEAVECAYVQGVEPFERLNRRVWAEQRAWKGSGDPAGVVRGWVSELGIDMQAFDGCLAADERISRIAASTTLARQIGVRGTPTFVILGYPPIQGALPLETFREVLNMVYAESEGAAEQGEPPRP